MATVVASPKTNNRIWPDKKGKKTIGKGAINLKLDRGSIIKPIKSKTRAVDITQKLTKVKRFSKFNTRDIPSRRKPRNFMKVLKSNRTNKASPKMAAEKKKEVAESKNEVWTITSKNIRSFKNIILS